MAVDVVAVLLAYLLGTFPTAVLVGRTAGFDPTAGGSGNPGASNSYRLGGRRAGAMVLAGDALKGAVPAAVGLLLDGRSLGLVLGVAAVIGHVAPATRRFQGGKGVATAAGMVAVVFPVAALGSLVVFVAVVTATRTAAVASLAAVAVTVPLAAWDGAGWGQVLLLVGVGVVIVVRHRDNLARLRAGDEHSIERST
jgi:glycerol-3-phosphate acyltransferase PlsY